MQCVWRRNIPEGERMHWKEEEEREADVSGKERATVVAVGRVRQGAPLETGSSIAQRHLSLCGGSVDVNGLQLRGWEINRHRRHRYPRICWDQDQVQKISRNIITQHLSSPIHTERLFFISQPILSNTSVALIPDTWPVQLIPNDGVQKLVRFIIASRTVLYWKVIISLPPSQLQKFLFHVVWCSSWSESDA